MFVDFTPKFARRNDNVNIYRSINSIHVYFGNLGNCSNFWYLLCGIFGTVDPARSYFENACFSPSIPRNYYIISGRRRRPREAPSNGKIIRTPTALESVRLNITLQSFLRDALLTIPNGLSEKAGPYSLRYQVWLLFSLKYAHVNKETLCNPNLTQH